MSTAVQKSSSSFFFNPFASKKPETPAQPTPKPPSTRIVNAEKIKTLVNEAYDLISDGKKPAIDQKQFLIYEKTFSHLVNHYQEIATKIKNKEPIDEDTMQEVLALHPLLIETAAKIDTVFYTVMLPHMPALSDKETPLHWAVRNHRYDDVRLLVQHGSPMTEDAQGLTPMEEALLQKDEAMINLLIFGGLDKEGEKLLWEKIGKAQEKLAAINALTQNIKSASPICQAAFRGDLDLLAKAINLDMPDANGLTPLHYALLGNQQSAVEFLAPRCKMYHLTKEGHSYLDYALASKNPLFFQYFSLQGIPFKIDTADNLFPYMVAADLHLTLAEATAQRKDPLAFKSSLVNVGYGNLSALALEGLLHATQWAGAAPGGQSQLDWTPWIAQGIHQGAQLLNVSAQVGRFWSSHDLLLEQGISPPIARYLQPLHGISVLLHHLAAGASWVWTGGNNGFSGLPEPFNTQDALMPHSIANKCLPGLGNILSKGYSMYRLGGVAFATLSKAGTYWNNFQSRPRDVMKCAATDLAILGSETLLCAAAVYGIFNSSLSP